MNCRITTELINPPLKSPNFTPQNIPIPFVSYIKIDTQCIRKTIRMSFDCQDGMEAAAIVYELFEIN